MTAAYTDKAKVGQALDLARRAAPHQVPLLEAAYFGLISMAVIRRESPFPARTLEGFNRPSIVLIGDDDGLDTGPNGWACRTRLPGWARYAVIHASGGEAVHYTAAVLMALEVQRLVFVETGTANFEAWHRLFSRANVPTLNLIVRDPEMHPIPRTAADLH